MSQENVEIVRRLFAAFQSVDLDTFERRFDEVGEILDPEVEWVAAPQSLLASEEYRGYDGVRRFWTQVPVGLGPWISRWRESGARPSPVLSEAQGCQGEGEARRPRQAQGHRQGRLCTNWGRDEHDVQEREAEAAHPVRARFAPARDDEG
jgi:hypothetical protein